MTMTDKNVLQRIVELQDNAPTIVKTETAHAKKFSYEYASLPHVLEVLLPAMRDVGIAHYWYTRTFPEKEGVFIACRVYSIDNTSDLIESVMFIEQLQFQQIGAQLTYYSRYLLLLLLGLVAEKDDDGEEATHRAKSTSRTSKSAGSSRRGRPQPERDDDDDYDDEEEEEEEAPPARRSTRRSYSRNRAQ